MNTLKKTLFIIAILILMTQTIRDIYVKWFEKRTSVLDKYDTPVERTIKEAGSIEKLKEEYEIAHNKVREYEQNEKNPKIKHDEKSYTEPYKTKEILEEAIREWESRSKEVYELRFFWICGLLIMLVGLLLYKKINNWLGFSFIIVGFVEMIWWSSPCFSNFYGGEPEYNRLLINKLILSIISLIILICLWLIDSSAKSYKK